MYTKSQLMDLVEILGGGNFLTYINDSHIPVSHIPVSHIPREECADEEIKQEDLHKLVLSFLCISPERIYEEVFNSWISRGKTISSEINQNFRVTVRNPRLRFFDQIYILNLDRRADRWERMKQQLAKHQIHDYQRFSAIDSQDPIVFFVWKNNQKKTLTWSEKRHKLKKKGIASAGSWAILSEIGRASCR